MAMIDVKSLTKTFRVPHVRRHTIREQVFGLFGSRGYDLHRVLDDVSFSVQPGETIGIMGRNGCGKSTLLRILAGIYVPDAGSVSVRGGVTALLELGVGWNPELDAVDNIYLLASAMGLTLREIRRALDEILAFAELERFANLKVGHYSSGMASRLAYAVAFKAVREILILDEIFAVGDAAFQAKCMERYYALRAAGHTILMVSHDPPTIARFCGRALLIEGGQIYTEGPGQAVADAYRTLLGGPGTTAQPRDGSPA